MYLKILFIITGLILFLMLSFYKLYFSKQQRTEKISVFISVMGGVFLFYIISAFLFTIFVPNIINKLVMLFFAISPFIIGKLATFPKEKFYSLIQIVFVLVSIIYITVL